MISLRHAFALAAAICSLGAVLPSQTCFEYPSGTSPAAGAPDPRPWGDTDPASATYGTMRYQLQIPSSVLGNQPVRICEIFVAPAGARTRTFTEFDLRMGHNPNPLTPQMVFNIVGGSARPVASASTSFTTVADQWNPVGMASTFVHDPSRGMLVLEFFVRDAGAAVGTGDPGLRTDPGIPFVWSNGNYNGTVVNGGGIKLRFCTDHYGFIEYGVGACAGSGGQTPRLSYTGTPQIGNNFAIELGGAPGNNALSVLVFSFRPRVGPFDLTGFGAPGCNAYVFGDDASWLFAQGSTLTVPYSLPTTLLPCFPVWNQWFIFDANANGLGVVSSNFGRVMIGQ